MNERYPYPIGTQVVVLRGQHKGKRGVIGVPTRHTAPGYERVVMGETNARIRRTLLAKVDDETE